MGYDVSSNTWTSGPDLPNHSYLPGKLISSNFLIYVGGYGNKNIYQLNSAQNGWIQIGEMAQRRYLFPALTMSENTCRGEKIEGKPTSTLLESGTLQSPNFPNKYSNNHDETYNIEVQTGKTIEIIFETFELEANSRCSYDWLKIIDGSTTLLEETCGSNVPTKLLSQTNKVEIIFHTDGSVTKRGFKLQWKASIEKSLWSFWESVSAQLLSIQNEATMV